MTSLNEKVSDFALNNGAHLVGFAPISRFDGAPLGTHPTDFLPDCKSVIVIASRILNRGLNHRQLLPNGHYAISDENIRRVMNKYFWEIECHGPTSDMLSIIGLRVAMLLQDEGYGSIYFRSSGGDVYGEKELTDYIKPYKHLFSHRHAAVRAGLGEFGLNNLVITSAYGPRVRLVTVLTEAELEYTPLVEKKICLGKKCGLCLTNCSHHGVLTVREDTKDDEIWLNPPSITEPALCRSVSAEYYCKGQCINKCPIGKKP